MAVDCSPNALAEGAKCVESCLPRGAQLPALISLFCTIANQGGGGGSGVPAGVIVMWSGTIATIPATWNLCDGTNGTPDLRDMFVVGARSDSGGVAKTNLTGALTQTGGSITHGHGVTDPGHTHTHTDPGHSHGITDPTHSHGVTDPTHAHSISGGTGIASGADFSTNTDPSGTGVSVDPAGTGITVNGNTTGITNNANTTGLTVNNVSAPQPYYALALIMKL